jgi:hypothetical protein
MNSYNQSALLSYLCKRRGKRSLGATPRASSKKNAKSNLFVQTMVQFGDNWLVKEEVIEGLEAFTCAV